MGDRLAIAFAVAAIAVLALGAIVRAVARRSSHPSARQMGGVVLLVAVPVGLITAAAVPTRALLVCAGACLLGVLGVVGDRITMPRWVVGAGVVGVSVVVAGTGLRFPAGGVPAVDFAWTVAWLALVTLAVANSGNADGQFPSLAAASVIGILGVAGFARQSGAATLAAALLGSLIAFLAYNLRPSSLYVGRGGALFVGFMIAAGALWARPSIGRPASLVVNVLLVGFVLLDGTIVVLSRLRRQRPLTVRIRDHVSHRLVAAGLRPSRMIKLITIVQLGLSAIAVFVARGILGVGIGALVGAVLLLVIAVLALRARMRDVGGVPGFSWRVRLLMVAVVLFCVGASLVAGLAALSSRTKVLAARDAAADAIQAARNGDSDRAVELFARAEADFAAADDRLGSIINLPSLVVPVVGSNVHAARELTRVGLDLSRAGRSLTEQINSDQLQVADGRVPLPEVAAIAPDLDRAAAVLQSSDSTISGLRRGYLVGELEDGVAQLRSELADAARDATRAAALARIAPLVLGDGTTRRYLLVVQNPAELRGTGGLVGNYGILTATDGDVDLESLERLNVLNARGRANRVLRAPKEYVDRYGRFEPEKSFQNANITPDFPTAAAVMADQYQQQFGGEPVDGVVAVDPEGLAALLEVTGPVRVTGWPTPISAENVVDVTLRDAYSQFRNTDRVEFIGDVARAAIDRATSTNLGSPDRLSRILGKAAHQGHFALWFADPEAQQIVDEVEISGRMPSTRGDSLLVSNTNAGANKLDYYLEKHIDYQATVTPSPDLQRAAVNSTVRTDFVNSAPPGLTQYVAGPWEGAPDRFVYGQNRSFVSVYSPLGYTGARVDDQPWGLEVAPELDRFAYSTFVDVFANQPRALSVDLSGTVDLRRGGWYDLTLVRQPSLHADRVTVRIQVPDGYRIVKAPGLTMTNGVAHGELSLEETRALRVKIGVEPGAGLWDRLRAGS